MRAVFSGILPHSERIERSSELVLCKTLFSLCFHVSWWTVDIGILLLNEKNVSHFVDGGVLLLNEKRFYILWNVVFLVNDKSVKFCGFWYCSPNIKCVTFCGLWYCMLKEVSRLVYFTHALSKV